MGLGQSGAAHFTNVQSIGGSVACSIVNAAVFCFVMLAKSLYLLGHTAQHCPGGVMGLGQSGAAHFTNVQSIGGSVACSIVNTAVLFCFVMLAKSPYLLGHTAQHCPGGVMGLGQSGAAHFTTLQSTGGDGIFISVPFAK